MDSNTLLYQGKSVPVTFRDGKPGNVRLRLIKISEIPAYLDMALDERKGLVFCFESPAFPFVKREVQVEGKTVPVQEISPEAEAFLDSITDESYLQLVDENTALNFTRALAMSDQRLKRAEQTGVGVAKVATDLASLLIRYSPNSAATSPKSS